MPADLRRIAHEALSLSEAPYLKHYHRGRFRTWNGVAMTGSELPGPGFNFAACLTDTPPLDEILPVAREFFADADQGWGVLVEGDAGHPVEVELRARGWQVAEDEPAFVMPSLSGSPPRFGEGPGEGSSHHLTPRPPSLRGKGELSIRPILSEEDWRTFQRVTSAAYGSPPELADLFLPSLAYFRDPAMFWVVADWSGEPVAAGGYYRIGPTAVVGGLATLEEHRGKGIGMAIVRALLADAAAKGCASACLRSGP
ncbi:MAG TPA: GNAT family N-acetyltransferase, partial [Fimbriiglobus sp.]|nr:GNAT family N-acetyltransferase [Fimbriiglobus sp.]